jgi:hypothetical protein
MGRFAIGSNALGCSSGFVVKVVNDDPGPQRMMACSPGAGIDTAWGILRMSLCPYVPVVKLVECVDDWVEQKESKNKNERTANGRADIADVACWHWHLVSLHTGYFSRCSKIWCFLVESHPSLYPTAFLDMR